ncbi:18193_t:CDS:2, partial [Racocetra fulgida]
PGTGKTEFINELVHHLYQQFAKENQLIPPVIEVKGAKLKSAGGITDQPSPDQKLISIIKHYKKEVFGDEFSPEPYIVFVEEADQGVDVMGGTGGKKNYLLEEYKNFLSTSQDKAGLAAEAQDPNSIIIIATNNFDLIDPAVVRRGRLGKKLNFN